MTDRTKIERLAGIPGKPEVVRLVGDKWCIKLTPPVRKEGVAAIYMYSPIRKTEQSAIRAWNAMVRRIRKANAQGLEGTK